MSQSVVSLIRNVVPVTSVPQEPVEKRAPGGAPGSGATCWGQPADFHLPVQGGPGDDGGDGLRLVVEALEESLFFRGVEVHREWEPVIVTDESTGNKLFEAETIKSVTFTLGEHEEVTEEREARGSVTFITPIIQHVREYLVFNFPVGQAPRPRGQAAPPPTPPLPAPPPVENELVEPYLYPPLGQVT